MKILHLGLMVNGRNEGLSRAFRKKATIYGEFRISVDLPSQIDNLSWTPELVFVQIQDEFIRNGPSKYHTAEFLGPAIQRLRDKGAFIINWTGDKRNGTPRWMFEMDKHVDLTCFSNEEDVNNFKSKGLKSEFLQIGIDPNVFHDHHGQGQGHDIVFMGNHHGHYPLSAFRSSLVSFMHSAFGNRFAVYGNNYPGTRGALNADGNNPFPMQSRESQIYNNSKIGLSVSQFTSERYTSDRLLRIMGSNCFALAYWYPGIEKDFEIGYHLDIFKTPSELRERVQYYLEHVDEREKIRDNGYKLIHANHTYDNMVNDIINLI